MKARPTFLLIAGFCFLFTGCKPDSTDAGTSGSSASAMGNSSASFAPAGYNLVWSDEFNEGTMPSDKNWG